MIGVRIGRPDPSEGRELFHCAVLLALAWVLVECQWTLATGAARPATVVWILVLAFAIATLGVLAITALRFAGLPVPLSALLLLPVLLSTLRPSVSPKALEAGWGPGRVGMALLLAGLIFRWTKGGSAPSRLWWRVLLITQLAVMGFVLRGIPLDPIVSAITQEWPRTVFFLSSLVLPLGLARVARDRAANRTLLPLLSALAVFASGFSRFGSTRFDIEASVAKTPQSTQTPNVVLIVLDTLRRDAVSANGLTPRRLTPNLDAVSQTATLFHRAYSSGTYTLPGHGSLFTGLLPSEHGGYGGLVSGKTSPKFDFPMFTTSQTIAVELQQHSYATGGLCANYGYLDPKFGFSRGFASYSARPPALRVYPPFSDSLRLRWDPTYGQAEIWSAPEVVRGALRWVSSSGRPFFLFLNFMDSHGIQGPGWKRSHPPRYAWRSQFAEVVKETPAARRDYESSVAFLDSELGFFFDRLKSLGLWEQTLVIVTSDHGEFFGEHGQIEHGAVLPREEVLAVPLIVKFPGQKAARREDAVVSVMDVPGIIRSALRNEPWLPAPASRPRVIAESWFEPTPLPASRPPAGVPYSRIAFVNQYKFVENWSGGDQLFDLVQDPGETMNLFDRNHSLASGIRDSVHRVYRPLRELVARPREGIAGSSPELLDKLRSLGYLR